MILDTNALSAIAEAEPEAAKQFARAGRVAIPVIVLGEYRFGFAHSRHQREYEGWLEDMVAVCDVLEVSDETAIWYAELRGQLKEAGTPIPSNGVWIAGEAKPGLGKVAVNPPVASLVGVGEREARASRRSR